MNKRDKIIDILASRREEKLDKKADHGFCSWQSMSIETIKEKLIDHVKRGDPVDVANFAMFWFYKRGMK